MRKLATVIIFTLLIMASAVAEMKPAAMAGYYDLAEPPVIAILSPENKTYATNNITLSFNVSIGKALEDVYYVHLASLYYKGDWQQNETLVGYRYSDWAGWYYAAGDSATFSYNLTEIPEGNHSILIYAKEIVAFPMISFTDYSSSKFVNFTVDTTPPNISVLSPEDRAYDTSDVALNFTLNESFSQVSYSLDGQENKTATGNMTLAGLSGGAHNVTVYAWDEAGNVGASETVTFSVAEPFPTIWTAAAAVSVVVVVGGLIFYLRKRKH